MSKPAADGFAAIVAAIRSLAHRGALPEEKQGDRAR